MRFKRWLARAAVATAALTGLATAASTTAQATPVASSAARGATSLKTAAPGRSVTLPAGEAPACAAPAPGHVTCATLTVPRSSLAAARARAAAGAAAAATPTGWAPADLRSAYDLPASLNTGATVAVVTAYGDTTAASDLGVYRSQYSLPACTIASGCLKIVNQTGSTSGLPAPASGWSAATSESLDAISAVCPDCHLLLVEANSSGITDLGAAENEAVALGAKFIVDPWGSAENNFTTSSGNETSYDTYFNHPGVAIVAPNGDSGYGVSYPAASPYVTAVGGTTLTHTTSGGRSWTETVEVGSGSGCSQYEPKPSWQTDTGCADRTVNDTAAAAVGIAYYDSPTNGGWSASDGTAASAALIAGIYALGGAPAPGSNPASYLYDHPGALWNITGSNGTCTPSYLCTAGSGYNGPAGMGVPDTDTAFSSPGAKPASVTDSSGNTWAFATDTSGAIEYAKMPFTGNYPYTGWTGWTSLGTPSQGGTFSGYPAALITSNNTTWVFALDGGILYDDYLTSGSKTWSGWNQVGGSNWVGTPTVIQDKSGTIHVFVRNISSGNVYENRLPSNGAWSGFTNLGGILPNDVSVEIGGGGWMNLVGVGNNDLLYQDSLPPNGSWSGWTRITPVSVNVTGTPAIIQDAWATPNVRVFVRQYSNGALLEDTQPGGSSTWNADSSLGGTWTTDPTAQSDTAVGNIYLYAVGITRDVYANSNAGSGWLGWNDFSSGYTGVVGASGTYMSNYNGSSAYWMNLLIRTTSGGIEAINGSEINGSVSNTYNSLGGSFAGS